MNLQEKLSGLKGLVTHSHSKRRFKADLTTDMISPPLGDFRHTMHVGRGGDVFGDTSFLSNHGGQANNARDNNGNGDTDSTVSTPDSKIGAFFSRTLRQIRRGSDTRPRENAAAAAVAKEMSPPPPAVSPIIKNAISLPRLDVVDMANGSPTKVLFPSSQSSPDDNKTSYGVDSGFVTLPRLSRSERQQPSISLPTSSSRPPDLHRGSLTDPGDALLPSSTTARLLTSDPKCTAFSDSLPSLTSLDFTFDLGPSLVSEVLGLLDGGHFEDHAHTWGEEEGLTNEGSEMDSATISYVDSLLREDCGGGKSPQWEEEEAEKENVGVVSVKMPDLVMASQERVKMAVGMESERFQSATDVLARHYGVAKGQKAESEMYVKKKISYSYIDDDDEIKV